jgi:hypothetical protein
VLLALLDLKVLPDKGQLVLQDLLDLLGSKDIKDQRVLQVEVQLVQLVHKDRWDKQVQLVLPELLAAELLVLLVLLVQLVPAGVLLGLLDFRVAQAQLELLELLAKQGLQDLLVQPVHKVPQVQ